MLALLVVAGAVAYWGNEATTGEPLGLDLPAPPAQQSATGSGTSGSAPGSSGALSASPADDIVTTTDDGGADPADAGVVTTTTNRPDGPPPDGPPDPPDPPGDTTRPVIAGESASNPRIFTMRCEEPTSSTVSATITDDSTISATLSWSGAGSNSVPMSPDGDQWSGIISGFTETGSVEWTITATDAAGNQSSSTGSKISVEGCASTR